MGAPRLGGREGGCPGWQTAPRGQRSGSPKHTHSRRSGFLSDLQRPLPPAPRRGTRRAQPGTSGVKPGLGRWETSLRGRRQDGFWIESARGERPPARAWAGRRPHLPAGGGSAPQRKQRRARRGAHRERRCSLRRVREPRRLASPGSGLVGAARALLGSGEREAHSGHRVRARSALRGGRGGATSPGAGSGLEAPSRGGGSPAAFSWAPAWQDARGGSGPCARGWGALAFARSGVTRPFPCGTGRLSRGAAPRPLPELSSPLAAEADGTRATLGEPRGPVRQGRREIPRQVPPLPCASE